MEDPLVSIIVPTYNCTQWIERTLTSALAQTYRDIEIIVVDDGSDDRTANVVEAVASSDERIRFFRRPHLGLSATRNFGIGQARGQFIAPLDADDLWHPEKLARQTAAMQKASSRVGLVYCWTVDIDENDFIIPPVKNGPSAEGGVLMELIAKGNLTVCGSNPLLRRSCIDAVGGYDTSLYGAEDWKLCLALAEICDFSVVPEHLVGYRRSATSLSRNENMDLAMALVSNWIIAKRPDAPAEVKRQNLYFRNAYLAHLALTSNQPIRAIRYQIAGYKSLPASLFQVTALVFIARVIARTIGFTRKNWPFSARSIPFKDFQSGPQLRVES